MQWQDLQSEFTKSLKTPELGVPDDIGKTHGAPSTKRFNVYRNNTAVSLSEALSAGFPVTTQLVGEEFFKAMAQVYMKDNLPASPVLISYGDTLPEFIRNFEPAQTIPYLADIALLEFYWTQAYNAADADPITIDALSQIPPEEIGDTRFQMHPSLHLIKSEWPVLTIWSAHHQDNTAEILNDLEYEPEQGLIVRPHLDVNVMSTLHQAYTFIEYAIQGDTLTEAFEKLETDDQEDLGGCLQFLFSSGAVTGIHNKQK